MCLLAEAAAGAQDLPRGVRGWRVPVRIHSRGESGPCPSRRARVCSRCRWQVTPAQLREQGNALFQAGDHAAALAAYTQALSLCDAEPERAVLHRNRAACYLKLVRSGWGITVGPAGTCPAGWGCAAAAAGCRLPRPSCLCWLPEAISPGQSPL